jgi:hypothetical protein
MRLVLRPIGYLAFVVALVTLSAAARFLGEKDELGFFSHRLAKTVWRYPEVTRRGVQTAWLVWAALLALALSPLDPLATQWDEVALAALAALAAWHHLYAERRAGH